jgi:hypothetical protein
MQMPYLMMQKQKLLLELCPTLLRPQWLELVVVFAPHISAMVMKNLNQLSDQKPRRLQSRDWYSTTLMSFASSSASFSFSSSSFFFIFFF